ncbi:hypothetical protein N7490_005004 [Penicillium lividum]|nr:hypothetical protein N7490_005004 [Penicillium lividum]
MASRILEPFVVFCMQPQSQKYIKTIRNLGDAWRTFAEEPVPEPGQKLIIIETTFDFTLKIKNELEDAISVEMTLSDEPQPTESSKPLNYRIWADYGTDFLWRQNDDIIEETDGESYVEAEEALSSFPKPVLELYCFTELGSSATATTSKQDSKTPKIIKQICSILPMNRWHGTWPATCLLGAWHYSLKLEAFGIRLIMQSICWKGGMKLA